MLAANAGSAAQAALATARQAWRDRRNAVIRDQRVLDTRFDAGSVLSNTLRRLVDVCGELGLDVTQPELARKSMTALNRDWLNNADTEARERITVLNLRHSLSTAYVALRASGTLTWQQPLNVNTMMAGALAGRVGWLENPTFQALTNGEGQ